MLDADGDGYADPTLNNGIGSIAMMRNENTYPVHPICDGVVNDCSGLILSLDETDDDMDDFVECTIDFGLGRRPIDSGGTIVMMPTLISINSMV